MSNISDVKDVEDYVERLTLAYQGIERHVPMSLGAEAVNDYGHLWRLCQSLRNKEITEQVCSDPRIVAIRPKILSLYADWCYLREIELAQKILAAEDAEAAFNALCLDFSRYERIVGLEHRAVKICAENEPQKALMVGSGPVSSTAIILRRLGMEVDCLDISEEANELSKTILTRFGIGEGINHITCDALALTDLSKYDVIWLAGFVGVADSKLAVINHLAEYANPGTFFAIRSASPPCNLLYTEIQPWELDAFERLMHLQPLSFNNNSTYIVRKPEAERLNG